MPVLAEMLGDARTVTSSGIALVAIRMIYKIASQHTAATSKELSTASKIE